MNRSAAHSALKHDIRQDLGLEPDLRLFDNPRGFDERAKTTYGMAPGATDLVGIVRPRGRWLALEVKTGSAQPEPQQRRFMEMIASLGGVARVVRSVAEARAAFEEARRQ